MTFLLIINNNINEEMWIRGNFLDEIENIVFSINGITLNRCVLIVTCTNLSW
jgi:hypothetical protein